MVYIVRKSKRVSNSLCVCVSVSVCTTRIVVQGKHRQRLFVPVMTDSRY